MKFDEVISEHKKALIPKYMMQNIEDKPPVHFGRSQSFIGWFLNEYGHAIPTPCYWDDIEKEYRDDNNGEIIGKRIMAKEELHGGL